MRTINEAFDTMAYLGGVAFFILLVTGCLFFVSVHFRNSQDDDGQYRNEDYKPYDWEDME